MIGRSKAFLETAEGIKVFFKDYLKSFETE